MGVGVGIGLGLSQARAALGDPPDPPAAGVGLTFNQLRGYPPRLDRSEWYDWTGELQSDRESNVPRTRATRYYFSSSGSNANSGLTTALPKQTLAAAITLLSGGSNIRVSMKRGDTFRAAGSISFTMAANNTWDDYGTGALPIVNGFKTQYLAGTSWTADSTSYYTSIANGVATATEWLRILLPGTNTDYAILKREDSVAHCKALANTFYPDEANDKLYVHIGTDAVAVSPTAYDVEAYVNGLADAAAGIAGSNGCRIQNIDFYGLGVQTTAGVLDHTYGIRFSGNATDEFVCKNVGVFFSGYHAIGLIEKGIGTLINCRTGYCRTANGGVDNIAVYRSLSGQVAGDKESIVSGCTAVAGNLFETGTNVERTCGHIISHTDDAAARLGLCILRDNTVTPGVMSCRSTVNSITGDPCTTLEGVRQFVVGDYVDEGTDRRIIVFAGQDYVAYDRCFYRGLCDSGAQYHFGTFGTGWVFNSKFIATASAAAANMFYIVADGGVVDHCWIQLNTGTGTGRMFGSATAGVNTGSGPDAAAWDGLKITNSILIANATTPGDAVFNLSNSAGNINFNAYYPAAIDPLTNGTLTGGSGGAGYGAIGDANKVLLTSIPADAAPVNGDLIYNADHSSGTDHDYYGNARNAAHDIGPVTHAQAGTVASIAQSIVFGTQPTGTTPGATLNAIAIAELDTYGLLSRGSNGSVTISIGTNPGSGTLSGTLTQTVTGGVAAFSDLSINNAGVGYTLDARASDVQSDYVSDAFTIASPTIADDANAVLWLKDQDWFDKSSVRNVDTGLCTTWLATVGPNFVAADDGHRPTVHIGDASPGLAGGSGFGLIASTPLLLTDSSDWDIWVLVTRHTGEEFDFLMGVGAASDSTFFQIDTGTTLNALATNFTHGASAAITLNGTKLLRIWNTSGVAQYQLTGGSPVTMTPTGGSYTQHIMLNCLLYHYGFPIYSAAGCRMREVAIFNAVKTGSAKAIVTARFNTLVANCADGF